jgi:hypothetical protein
MGRISYLWVFVSLATLAAGDSYALMFDVPDHIKNKPEQEQLQYLNSEFEQAYTLQLKVGKERYEQRMGTINVVVETMASQAFERQKLIEEAQQEVQRELEASAKQSDLALGGIVLTVGLLLLVAWCGAGEFRLSPKKQVMWHPHLRSKRHEKPSGRLSKTRPPSNDQMHPQHLASVGEKRGCPILNTKLAQRTPF